MIELRRVTKHFGNQTAVAGISFTVKRGEIVGLLGPNGAGKTTTIRMIAGVLPVTKGEIRIGKQVLGSGNAGHRGVIGYLPENNPLYYDMTVEEHLHFYARLKSIPQAQVAEEISFAVKRTGIESVYYRFIGDLSKGFKQRVGLAQAILGKPQVLLLDEPTEGLDPNQRKDIQSLLSDLQKDRTVLLSSHVLSEIGKIADRVIIMHQGSIVSDDTPDHLAKSREGGIVYELEIQGTRVVSVLKKHEAVASVHNVSPGVYRVVSASQEDIRGVLFDLAVEHSWKILSSTVIERQLEDIFHELTT